MPRTRLAAAIALSLAALAAHASPARAAIATADGAHVWAFDAGGAATTEAQAEDLAGRADVIVGSGRYLPWLSDLASVRPGVVVAPYHSGVAVDGSALTWIRANHPRWLLRGPSGQLLHNRYGRYLINPASAGVRSWQAAWARKTAAEGWGGIYLDALGLFGLNAFGTKPIDPSTGAPFTPARWIRATSGLASAVNRAVAVPVLGNGLGGGTAYWNTDGPGGARRHPLAMALDGGVFEGCFRQALSPLADWPSQSDWLAQLTAFHDAQRDGRWALCLVKTWASGTAAQRARWHDFTLASYLLAKQRHTYYAFAASPSASPLADGGEQDLAIGTPTGARFRQGALWLRRFATGIAVVNPTASRHVAQLGGSYALGSGATVTRLAVPAHSGVVLTK